MISSFVRALVSRGPRTEAGATAAQRASTFWPRCGPGLDPGFRSGAWHPVLCQNSALLKTHVCNLMHRKVLVSFYQHLMAEAPMRSV